MPEHNMVKSKRWGRFHISRHIVEDQPTTVLSMLAGMVIVRAEMMYHLDSIEYYAYADEFEEVDEGAEAPFYTAEMSQDAYLNADGSVCRTVEKFVRWAR